MSSQDKVMLRSPYQPQVVEETATMVEEYTGPTADDLRREAELFRQNWEQEKLHLVESAKQEAKQIISDAEERAFSELKHKNDEAQKNVQDAEAEAESIIEAARKNATEITETAERESEQIREDARKEGFAEGREAGYQEGIVEAERLSGQLQRVLDKTIERRTEIIEDSETQIIELVLMIARKVVKVISENQKNVVVNNVIQALRKLKSRGEVLIRVNLEDVELASDRVKDFVRMVENVRSVTVVEDSTVDRGGCVIETDFGEIDARISSQLKEIEDKILELAPIRSRTGEESNS
jgi:flagellar assembly protein FliH